MLIDNPTKAQWTELRERCMASPDDMNHLNAFPYANRRASADQLLAMLRSGRFQVWLIQPSDQVVGFLNFGNVIPHYPNAFGILIGRAFVGRGYARKALKEFISRREEFGIQEINGYCHPENAAIRTVMETCGFKKVPHQDPHPAVKYSLNG